jgi:general secretion pathway protein K
VKRAPLPGQQRGAVALMFAMLIVALCTLYAVSLAWDTTLDVRRTTNLLWREQAVQVALGAEQWVGVILSQDQQDSQADHLGEIWAQQLPPLPVEGAGMSGDVSGGLVDLQGRFNINNLLNAAGEIDEPTLEQFRRLLRALGLEPQIAGAVADWLDADTQPFFPDGAEDGEYTGRIPPYRSANSPVSSASEIAAVIGVDAESYRLLRPHVTALPGRTSINVNTATPAVLMSLDENVTAADAERLVAEREETGFADVTASFSTLVQPEVLNTLGESTNYFRLESIVRIGTVRLTMYSLLQRGPQGDVTPILRTFGAE